MTTHTFQLFGVPDEHNSSTLFMVSTCFAALIVLMMIMTLVSNHVSSGKEKE